MRSTCRSISSLTPQGKIRKLYDVRRRFGLGTSRVTYVIDRQGVIRAAFHNEVSMSSHINNSLDALAAIG